MGRVEIDPENIADTDLLTKEEEHLYVAFRARMVAFVKDFKLAEAIYETDHLTMERPRLETYTAIAHVLLDMKDWTNALHILRDRVRFGLHLEAGALFSAGLNEVVECIMGAWQENKPYSFESPQPLYKGGVQTYPPAGRAPEAIEKADSLTEAEERWSAEFRARMVALVKDAKLDEALFMTERLQMERPRLETYTSIAHVLLDRGEWRNALDVLRNHVQHGSHPETGAMFGGGLNEVVECIMGAWKNAQLHETRSLFRRLRTLLSSLPSLFRRRLTRTKFKRGHGVGSKDFLNVLATARGPASDAFCLNMIELVKQKKLAQALKAVKRYPDYVPRLEAYAYVAFAVHQAGDFTSALRILYTRLRFVDIPMVQEIYARYLDGILYDALHIMPDEADRHRVSLWSEACSREL